jgi:hypothetical protein
MKEVVTWCVSDDDPVGTRVMASMVMRAVVCWACGGLGEHERIPDGEPYRGPPDLPGCC